MFECIYVCVFTGRWLVRHHGHRHVYLGNCHLLHTGATLPSPQPFHSFLIDLYSYVRLTSLFFLLGQGWWVTMKSVTSGRTRRTLISEFGLCVSKIAQESIMQYECMYSALLFIPSLEREVSATSTYSIPYLLVAFLLGRTSRNICGWRCMHLQTRIYVYI